MCFKTYRASLCILSLNLNATLGRTASKCITEKHKVELWDLLYLLYCTYLFQLSYKPEHAQLYVCVCVCGRGGGGGWWWLEVCLQGSVGDTNKSQRDFGPKRHQAMGPVTSEVPTWMTGPMGGHQHQLRLSAAHWQLTQQILTYFVYLFYMLFCCVPTVY